MLLPSGQVAPSSSGDQKTSPDSSNSNEASLILLTSIINRRAEVRAIIAELSLLVERLPLRLPSSFSRVDELPTAAASRRRSRASHRFEQQMASAAVPHMRRWPLSCRRVSPRFESLSCVATLPAERGIGFDRSFLFFKVYYLFFCFYKTQVSNQTTNFMHVWLKSSKKIWQLSDTHFYHVVQVTGQTNSPQVLSRRVWWHRWERQRACVLFFSFFGSE